MNFVWHCTASQFRQSSFLLPPGRHHASCSALSAVMNLTDLPEDVVQMARTAGHKRPRSDCSNTTRLDGATRPRVEDAPIPPIRVDKDLLLQVVRVKVQTLIRSAQQREQSQLGMDTKHTSHCTAERLERLVPVIEQRWLQDLLNGDEPRYGLDEVVQALQEIVHSDDGQ